MKCVSCGGEIGLTDKVCPYCGREIKETARHRAELKNYNDRNEKTKRKLSKTFSENMPMVISAIVMVVLIIAVIAAAYVANNAYTFRSEAMRKDSVKNYDEYSVIIQDYLDAGDYTGFVAFKEYHGIYEWKEPYKDLKLLWEIAKEYNAMVSNVESVVMFGDDADWYRPDMAISDCRRAIFNFYHEYEYNYSDIEEDPYAEYIHDMKDKADIIMRIYLGVDDVDGYLASSDIDQEAYLEEVLINE